MNSVETTENEPDNITQTETLYVWERSGPAKTKKKQASPYKNGKQGNNEKEL